MFELEWKGQIQMKDQFLWNENGLSDLTNKDKTALRLFGKTSTAQCRMTSVKVGLGKFHTEKETPRKLGDVSLEMFPVWTYKPDFLQLFHLLTSITSLSADEISYGKVFCIISPLYAWSKHMSLSGIPPHIKTENITIQWLLMWFFPLYHMQIRHQVWFHSGAHSKIVYKMLIPSVTSFA